MSETYGIEELETGTFPLTYKIIHKYQRKDKQLLKILKRTIDSNISTDHTNTYRITRSPFVEAEKKLT